MNKFKKIFITLTVFIVLVMPAISLAQGSLIPCNNTTVTGQATPARECDFNAFMALINGVINFLLFKLSIPIAAIMFAYAGFLLIKAQGGEAKTQAKGIFTDTVLGLVAAMAAWIVVKTILSILGYQGDWIGF